MDEELIQLIKRQNDPEILKQGIIFIAKYAVELQKAYQEELDRKARAAQLKMNLEDKILILKKLIFGRKSEKRPEATDRERDNNQTELLIHSRSIVPRLAEKNIKKLAEDEVIMTLTDDELKKESELRGIENPSAEQWEKEIYFFETSTEVTVLERQYKKTIYKRQKYRLKEEFNNFDKEVIITAPNPEKLLPGCSYSVDFATSVVTDKYINHIPLERQTRMMESLDLKNMSTKTLYNLCLAVSVHLGPIAEKIKNDVLSQKKLVVHADETPWPIQIKEQDDGYMWVISNAAGSFYVFEPTRSGEIIKEILKTYSGPVMCDGYTGYNRLKELKTENELNQISLVHCWAHARRKFTDIEENYPNEVLEIANLMKELFHIEKLAQSFDELIKIRFEQSTKVVDKIKTWLLEKHPQTRPDDYLRKAIEYCFKYWDGLTAFLQDERVPLTNNEAERTIRHAVMGRKNFYGSRTHNGADVAATLYTVIESCKKVELDPRTYINMIVKNIVRDEETLTPLEYARKTRSQN